MIPFIIFGILGYAVYRHASGPDASAKPGPSVGATRPNLGLRGHYNAALRGHAPRRPFRRPTGGMQAYRGNASPGSATSRPSSPSSPPVPPVSPTPAPPPQSTDPQSPGYVPPGSPTPQSQNPAAPGYYQTQNPGAPGYVQPQSANPYAPGYYPPQPGYTPPPQSPGQGFGGGNWGSPPPRQPFDDGEGDGSFQVEVIDPAEAAFDADQNATDMPDESDVSPDADDGGQDGDA